MVNISLRHVTSCLIAGGITALLFACSTPSFARQKTGKAPSVDTFKLADQLIAKRKFRKAAKLYSAYNHSHPKDFNAVWKQAQTQFWLNNFRRSNALYKAALKMAPANDYLRLNYIHSLLDMGRSKEAADMLTDMELSGRDYSDMSTLRAQMAYYNGDYREAAAYMRKSLNAESNNAEAHALDDQVSLSRAPLVSINTAYLSDNQPYTALISSIKVENYFSKYADLFLMVDEYHFMHDTTSDAPWVRVGDKLYFPGAGMHLNVSVGAFGYPVKHEIGWSGALNINEKISSQFNVDVNADHVPYFDTRTSIDTTISVTRVSAMLNWHLRNWSAQAAVLNSTFPDNTNVTGTYGWVLAPIVSAARVQLSAGASAGYSSSGSNTYSATETPAQVEAHFAANPTVPGIYSLYFTPNQQFTTTGLLQLSLYPSKVVDISIGGDAGYGSANAPYLYLNKDVNGSFIISRGYAMQTFTPADARATVNFHIGNSWLISLKYVYTNTYFFTSNYAGLGIRKSFIARKRHSGEGKSTFSRLIRDIEDQIQALYKSADPDELKANVAAIRSHLATLRDAQKTRMSASETVQGSDDANANEDRYDNVNEMIEELDAVDLGDYTSSGKGKKEWLVEKLFELTSIRYNGNLD
jgi:Tetratricopeptide repeat